MSTEDSSKLSEDITGDTSEYEPGGERFRYPWADDLESGRIDEAVEKIDRAIIKKGSYRSEGKLIVVDDNSRTKDLVPFQDRHYLTDLPDEVLFSLGHAFRELEINRAIHLAAELAERDPRFITLLDPFIDRMIDESQSVDDDSKHTYDAINVFRKVAKFWEKDENLVGVTAEQLKKKG